MRSINQNLVNFFKFPLFLLAAASFLIFSNKNFGHRGENNMNRDVNRSEVEIYQSASLVSKAINAEQFTVAFIDIEAQHNEVFDALLSLDKRFGNNYMLSMTDNALHLFSPRNTSSTEQNKKTLWKSLYTESLQSNGSSFDWDNTARIDNDELHNDRGFRVHPERSFVKHDRGIFRADVLPEIDLRFLKKKNDKYMKVWGNTVPTVPFSLLVASEENVSEVSQLSPLAFLCLVTYQQYLSSLAAKAGLAYFTLIQNTPLVGQTIPNLHMHFSLVGLNGDSDLENIAKYIDRRHAYNERLEKYKRHEQDTKPFDDRFHMDATLIVEKYRQLEDL